MRRAPIAAVVAVLTLLTVVGVSPAAPSAEPTPSAPAPSLAQAPVVLPPVAAEGQPPGTPALRSALTPLLTRPALGGPGAVVVDAATGRLLFSRAGTTPRIPASLAKLVTGASVLHHRDPGERLRTRVVTGRSPGEIVLVGAGDPTLTGGEQPPGAYPQFASLEVLAGRTAQALAGTGTDSVRLRVDDTLFAGPAVSDDWKPSYVTSGVVAPVRALALDGGRLRPGLAARAVDPALAAGQRFAELLEDRGIEVRGEVARAAPPQPPPAGEVQPPGAPQPAPGRELAAVPSPPLSVLVEHMLRTSDNDLAEALWRLGAIGAGEPATFAGGQTAALAALRQLGVPTDGVRLLDGSGLSRGSRLTPVTVARLLEVAAGDDVPRLRPLLTGLPVAGFNGTLAERFEASSAAPGTGEVRAKTGTLSGVSGLAGTAVTDDGRLLLLALMADEIPPGATLEARAALDAAAATVAECRCRPGP